jgi:uncharacterized protein
MEKISSDFSTKEFVEGQDTYTLKAYASIFGNEDLDGDIVEKGAFIESLKARTPQLLWGHDQSGVPIGRINEIYEDHKGLYYEASLPKEDAFVRDRIAPQLKLGSLKGNSIGFRTKDRERRKEGGSRIKKADLWEISLVTIPANPLANVENFKSLGAVPYNADLPLAERNKPWNPDEALARVKEFTGADDEPNSVYKSAFLYAEPGASDDPSSYKFLIADVINGRLTVIPAALYKAATALMRVKSGELDSPVRDAIQENLDRYYARLELQPATKALSKSEWNVLEADECEARLRALGLSGGLAKALSSGQRDVGRSPRDAGLHELSKSLSAIQKLVEENHNG